jgi:Flp pilus assembly protein TadD
LQAISLRGETVQILNDQGYSYMLRGNLSAARRKFEKAYALDPTNPVNGNKTVGFSMAAGRSLKGHAYLNAAKASDWPAKRS